MRVANKDVEMDVWAYQESIRNEAIRGKVGVAPGVDKMREARLRWFRRYAKVLQWLVILPLTLDCKRGFRCKESKYCNDEEDL
ncbi:hypothetical protein H5410_031402 [Solanum commersonii]|uniref:Uncharacterized protein n=1 Tax=Solanum commersonii TaxID=4109 RepID=A0A9J5YK31_SOLCO|nr:hypothetical protein H5410_031402 [Solanum commersonii]